jgi:ribosomal protein S18 acetylase RimI-like enzyme
MVMKIEGLIRPARSQDMAACAAIMNNWIDETDWMPRVHTHEAVVRYYQQDVFTQRKVLVMDAANTIAGMAVLDIKDHMVTALYVARNFRNQGVGKMLLEKSKAELGDRVSLWTFQANVGAQKFYAREGFEEINRTDGDNEEGLPDILMEWRG